jgi:hypothetical protein
VAPTSGTICLGIYFDIKTGTIQIPHTKLQEVLSLCKFYFSKSKITKKQLQVFLGSLMFLHKPNKPAWLFVNHIDCEVEFRHILCQINQVAELLSRWSSSRRPLASFFSLLNLLPVGYTVPSDALALNYTI